MCPCTQVHIYKTHKDTAGFWPAYNSFTIFDPMFICEYLSAHFFILTSSIFNIKFIGFSISYTSLIKEHSFYYLKHLFKTECLLVLACKLRIWNECMCVYVYMCIHMYKCRFLQDWFFFLMIIATYLFLLESVGKLTFFCTCCNWIYKLTSKIKQTNTQFLFRFVGIWLNIVSSLYF